MSKLIGDKVGRMELSTIALFKEPPAIRPFFLRESTSSLKPKVLQLEIRFLN